MQHQSINRFYQDLLNLCQTSFGRMLQDGLPLQALLEAANNVQPIAAGALQRAGINAMVELGMAVGQPTDMEPQPQQPPQEHHGSEPHNHGPDDDGEMQGNPFNQ